MASNNSELIKVEKLSKQYDNDGVVTPVLHNLSFTIKPGEFVSIMGPSGSGKSTLMHILGFLDKLSSGQYWFEGRDVSGLNDDELAVFRLEKVGFVFQQFNLLPKTTVLENVKLPLLYTDLAEEERVSKARETIKAVGLEHRVEYLSNQLSGGEKQRVAIARALVNNPSLVFADEPTGNLDSKSGAQIMKILFDLNVSRGHTVILVTHEMYTASHAQRILRLKDGGLVSDEAVPESTRQQALSGELK
ncbi:TPA: macrolide ABC transporter ATP-binding protein [Patescibacteria group bacterium]|nr:MAG: ABC transporter related protein [Parcubacteria group bacterium GW2011_GWA2_46_39]HBV33042.1 macrolide ABC transporter ATP-binding protein [Patescibacteria group bacterium]HCU47447.1 macrolide ABC transporter ATP-binding protein [Patescibacteria group bacterium]